MQKKWFLSILSLGFVLISCLGVGTRIAFQESFVSPLPYDEAFELALTAAREMSEECGKINPHNYPVLVSLGTSKLRGVITMNYRFDPEAGSVCTKPPMSLSAFAKEYFVPHFGAEFYIHIRFIREGDLARGVKVEVTQMKGVKKEIFEQEMEKIRATYLEFLKRHWK